MVIVAESPFAVETIRLALGRSTGLEVIARLDGRAAIGPAVRRANADIVLIDEMRSESDALGRIRECHEAAPAATILVLSVHMDRPWVTQALRAGAAACLSKSTHAAGLGTVIREVAQGHVVTAIPATPDTDLAVRRDDLTPREQEILLLAARGLTNARIGQELWVTEQTVKFHLSNVYRKLGIRSRSQLVRLMANEELGRSA